MNAKCEYKFEERIIIRNYKGDITVDDIVSSWNYLINNKLITPGLKGIISDFREADFLVDKTGFKKLSNYYSENIDLISHLKLAQLITTSKIVFTILFEDQNPQIPTKAFSTMGAARRWVLA